MHAHDGSDRPPSGRTGTDEGTVEGGYLLANAVTGAADRLAAMSEIFDPVTFRHLRARGIGPGWRCWEVGAGGTTVVTWLAEAVGPGGTVVATDLDTSLLEPVAGPNVDVLRHDVARDQPPAGPFDLVHARLVLVHVPDRRRALEAMAGALKPGGWLVVEDADPALQPLACPDMAGPDEELANKVRSAFRTLLAGRGADLAYGRTLPRSLREVGLVDVAAEGWFPLTHRRAADLEQATVTMLRAQLRTSGLVDDDEIDRHLATVAAGRLDLAQPPLISAWGRRPA